MTKDLVLGALPCLSKADLKQVIAVANSLLGPEQATNTPDGPIGWLLAAFNDFTGAKGGHWPTGANKRAADAIEFLQRTFPTAMNQKVTALLVMRYMLRLLADDL